jgi:hypothetical protein
MEGGSFGVNLVPLTLLITIAMDAVLKSSNTLLSFPFRKLKLPQHTHHHLTCMTPSAVSCRCSFYVLIRPRAACTHTMSYVDQAGS